MHAALLLTNVMVVAYLYEPIAILYVPSGPTSVHFYGPCLRLGPQKWTYGGLLGWVSSPQCFIRRRTPVFSLTLINSFVAFGYKSGFLVDRAFKIKNTWVGFHDDISNLSTTLGRNLFLSYVVENVVQLFNSTSLHGVVRNDNCLYFKLPYVGPFSSMRQHNIKKLVKTFATDLDIMLVFTPLRSVRSCVVYKFSCAGCSQLY